MDKNTLLKKIQMYDFCCVDLNLYLNSHPFCTEAMKLFNKYNKLLKDAKDEYFRAFGPLEASMINDDDTYWKWVQGPWPWEMED